MKAQLTQQFIEGHENANKYAMDHPMFGVCPYPIGSINNIEWNNGFSWAFEHGALPTMYCLILS